MRAVLQASELRVALGGRPVLHGIDASLPAGRWTAVVGPNGAGKSTLLQALAGLLPHGGQVSLGERPLPQWGRRERARQLAWLGQGQEAPADLSVQDLVMLGRLPHQGWQAQASPEDLGVVQQALQATDTAALAGRALGTLSGGERQRVLLARALAVQAPVLLMDEPLLHLDAPHQALWWQVVRDQVARGVTVLSVLHELSLALQADELWVMQAGRLVHRGAPAEAATREALQAVFGQRLALHCVQGQWVALPRLAGQA
jgi:iron complex transport system ATP-binding protein